MEISPQIGKFLLATRPGCGKSAECRTTAFGRRPMTDKDPPHAAKTICGSGYNTAVSFVIRDFEPEDFETLWRMDQECFPPGISYSKRELRAYLGYRGAFTLVAVDTDSSEPQGFIVAQGGNTGHIITIDVVAGARRLGVGSTLINATEERLRAKGCRAVDLETAVDNLGALSFYKRHGYSVIRTWPRYYSNGVDALVLEKLLNGA